MEKRLAQVESAHCNVSKHSQKRREQLLFLQLPDDVLFAIFNKCDIKTLGRLCRVCQKLNCLVQLDSVWNVRVERLFMVGSSCMRRKVSKTNGSHSLPVRPCLKEQCRLSSNWVQKICKERVISRISPKQLPWLQYVEGRLWCSMNNTIKCYNVHKDGIPKEDLKSCIILKDEKCHRKRTVSLPDDHLHHNLHNEDISRFVIKENISVSGCRDGSIYVFDIGRGECLEKLHRVHSTDTQTVDIYDTCIISGSRDKSLKILCLNDREEQTEVKMSINMQDRVWSTSFSSHGQSFAVGTSGCKGSLPLTVWDTNTGQFMHSLGKLRYGAGILDIKYEDDNILLSCGYECCLKMWDLRTQQCVASWQEPFDSTLYCIQTDGNVAMVTGTARYGMSRLWDKRKTESVQEYFMSQRSPVYSVAFDSYKLYAALDSSINMLKFSGY
ncbi:F-box/WD repeat-containing protein 4 [Mactra antiquata]